MSHRASRRVPHLSETDLRQIRDAIRHWGKPAELIHEYGEALLRRHFDWWEEFVAGDWDEDLRAEYDHDIGCRTWIQIAIEHARQPTKERLETLVRPLDDTFKRRMRPTEKRQSRSAPLKEAAYFWETHTIMRRSGDKS